MALLLQAMTSEDDEEITKCLEMVLKSSKLGLVHESINVNRIRDYTRSWFACELIPPPYYTLSVSFHMRWNAIKKAGRTSANHEKIGANSVFAQTILDLAQRKPHLVFGKGGKAYVVQ